MVSFNVCTQRYNGKPYKEGFCLSSDTKPITDIANGSILVEIDTGKVFFFNEAGAVWVEQFSVQG